MTTEKVQPVAPSIPSVFEKHGATRPMTDEEAKFMITLSIAEMKQPENPLVVPVKFSEMEDKLKELANVTNLGFGLSVLLRRLAGNCPDMKALPGLILLLSDLITSPGNAVILAYSLFRATKGETALSGKDHMTMTDFCMSVAPMGFPTEERFKEVWAMQKGTVPSEPDNWLDTRLVWQ